MKTAVIIHGWNDKSEWEDPSRPNPSNDHWIPWIQRQLSLRGIVAQAPDMPGLWDPHYEDWKNILDKLAPDEETLLVGHSCGAGFLVRWLSENDVKVGKVVLVAPWLDPEHMIDPNFFKFEIDSDIVSKTKGLTIVYSTDDYPDILKSVEILKLKLNNVEFKEFHDKGHFVLDSLKTEKFTELLEIILE